MTTPTYRHGERVRLTVPDNYADHLGASRRLGVGLVFRVMLQVGDVVRVRHEVTGQLYELPTKQLTRVGQ